ncbi:diguanylate cyclase [Vibrio sp. HN007]|uniref:sensor domain-containing diguanylate cyclase n=1 Tax=Vibrio iocasae TaxID=3098914 RepID=UPI0035D44BF1
MPELKINETYGVIIIKDLEPVYVDDNYARIYGYNSAGELLLNINSFLDLIDPKDHQAAKDNYFYQISGIEVPRGRTFKNKDRYGRVFTVFAIDHVVEWEGEPALQVTVVDMSMTERMQRKLRENEQKFKNLITSSGQGICIHRDFQPLLVNQAWVDLMHAPSIEYVLENVNVIDFIPKKDHGIAKQRYDDIINEKLKSAHILVENICFDGQKRYFNVYDNKIDWDGEPAMQAVIEDVTEKVKLEEELKRLSVTDPLTQLSNRRKLNTFLEEEQQRFNRYSVPFSIILIDLDHFKEVNDTWGHDSGDSVLVQVAEELNKRVRKVDEVGRWGGEEFLIVCPNTELSGAHHLAKKLNKAIEILHVDKRFSVTASMGVVAIQNGESARELIIRADNAMYAAKHKGRNQVIVEG